MVNERIGISGMSCAHCVRAVREALAGVDGVSVDEVEIGHAVVGFDPAMVDREAIVMAVVDAGYEVRSADDD